MRGRQLVLDLPLPEGMSLADFLPADGNREALAAVLAWPAWPTTALTANSPPSITGEVLSIAILGSNSAWDSGNMESSGASVSAVIEHLPLTPCGRSLLDPNSDTAALSLSRAAIGPSLGQG